MTPCPKTSWPSKAEAKREARRAMAVYGRGEITAYRCPSCDRWHIGHELTVKPCSYCGAAIRMVPNDGGPGRWPSDASTGAYHECDRPGRRARR